MGWSLESSQKPKLLPWRYVNYLTVYIYFTLLGIPTQFLPDTIRSLLTDYGIVTTRENDQVSIASMPACITKLNINHDHKNNEQTMESIDAKVKPFYSFLIVLNAFVSSIQFRVFIATIKSPSDTIFFINPDNAVGLKSVETRRSNVTLEPICLKTATNRNSRLA